MFSQGLQHFTAEAVVPEQLLHYVTAVAGSRPRPSQTEKRPFPAKAIAPGGASRAYRGRWLS